MKPGGVYHFAFMFPNACAVRLDYQRDKASMAELMPLLCPPFDLRKYQTILNQTGYECDLGPIIKENGILVLTTRAPLSDHESQDRRKVDRSNTQTEISILKHCFSPFFDNLSRSFQLLKEKFCGYLEQPAFAAIKFRLNVNGDIYSLQRRNLFYFENQVSEDYKKSVGNLILLQPSETMPRILAVWAPNGENNLVFCSLLRTGLWEKLNIDVMKDNRIAMVVFSTKLENRKQKADFSWIQEEIGYEVVLNVPVP